MATALLATPQPTTVPPSVLLNVTGAPSPAAAVYTSNFGAGADGWTASGTNVNTTLYSPPGTLYLTAIDTLSPAGNIITASKTVTGLTIGVQYRLRVMLQTNDPNAGNTRTRITGGVAGAFVALVVNKNTTIDLLFTATATSHVVNVDQQRTTGAEAVFINNPAAVTGAVTVTSTATWQGTRITRTDANGTAVPVRNPGNVDTVAGVMALTDYDAAMTGVLTYTVTDGAGGTATATTSLAATTRTNLTTNPSFETGTTGWSTSPSYWNNAGATLTRDNTWAAAGTWSGKVSCDGTAAQQGVAAAPLLNPASANTTYTISATVRNVSGRPVWIRVRDTVNAINGDAVANAIPPGQTGRISTTITTGAAATNLQVGITTDLTAAASLFYYDAILVEVAPTAGAYFDGDTVLAGTGNVWAGTPHASTSTQTSLGGRAPSLTLPATVTAGAAPSTVPVTLVTDYAEASESQGTVHTILGRTDKLSNPGTLLARAGTIELLAGDYPAARAVREMLKAAGVALLRQGDYPGLDLYFVARAITIQPAEPTPSRHWITQIAYDEVPRP